MKKDLPQDTRSDAEKLQHSIDATLRIMRHSGDLEEIAPDPQDAPPAQTEPVPRRAARSNPSD